MQTINDLPIILEAEHIAQVLGISKHSAYELMKRKGFPVLKIGRLKRVNRDAFFRWMEEEGGA